jgi:predicted ATPase/DNA-binding SARP family transcriptional activator
MEFRILGPLEVEQEGRLLKLGGAKQRGLLALLLLNANEAVARDRLIDELWGGEPPETVSTAIQGYVSHLRKALGRDVIITQAPGYLIRTRNGELDLDRFEQTVAKARTASPAAAAELLRDALALWRGVPLAELDTSFARAARSRLQEQRVAALEQRIDADLALGRHPELVAELDGFVGEHPLRERLRGQLMLALYRCGRQAEALDVYRTGRRLLDEELGLEPGEELRRLERAILEQDESLSAAAAGLAPTRLPTGTVTFLFTDIEGSTRLERELGAEQYAGALAEHRRLLREAFARHDGVEIDTQGDAFFVAFATAPNALAAAAAGQELLAPTRVRVRMGLHTGTPFVTDSRYVGADVHRAARVMGAAHGGQVLVSESTRALLEDGVLVRDLGEHRLKDLSQSQRLYQLGQEDFPPLKTLDATNLPIAANPLLGRERELDELVDLLRNGTRLVTVTGPGGTGKTRLALQVAAELVGSFEHGVFWVPLAALTDPEVVVLQIAQTIGARDDLPSHVRDKEMLLLLDNLEHLLAAAPALGELLAGAKGLRLLVTSRAPLHVRGEREYPLDPLAEPDAVTLFVERARDSGRELDADDTIAAICRRLDNLPLAIELAAARTKVLAPETLLERLDHALPLLTGGARDAPERQQTLRATIEWSYDLLDDEAKQLFGHLAVFAGTFSLEAAEAVCDASIDTLATLVDLSLLKPIAGSRFLMLETIREHAVERIAAAELDELRVRHVTYFVELAGGLRDGLVHGRSEAVDLLGWEQANLRAALAFGVADTASDALPRLVLALGAADGTAWWNGIGTLAEAQAWLERALERTGARSTTRAALLLSASSSQQFILRDPERTKAMLSESLELARELGDPRLEARALHGLGLAAINDGELDDGVPLLEQALEAHRAAGDSHGVSYLISNLGTAELFRGNPDRARAFYAEAAAIDRVSEFGFGLAVDLFNHALVDIREGDLDGASPWLAESLEVALRLPRGTMVPNPLVGFAAVAVSTRPDTAVRLLTVARRELAELGEPLETLEQQLYDQTWEDAHARLTPDEFGAAEADGARMTLDHAAQLALSLRGG